MIFTSTPVYWKLSSISIETPITIHNSYRLLSLFHFFCSHLSKQESMWWWFSFISYSSILSLKILILEELLRFFIEDNMRLRVLIEEYYQKISWWGFNWRILFPEEIFWVFNWRFYHEEFLLGFNWRIYSLKKIDFEEIFWRSPFEDPIPLFSKWRKY